MAFRMEASCIFPVFNLSMTDFVNSLGHWKIYYFICLVWFEKAFHYCISSIFVFVFSGNWFSASCLYFSILSCKLVMHDPHFSLNLFCILASISTWCSKFVIFLLPSALLYWLLLHWRICRIFIVAHWFLWAFEALALS